MVQIVKKAKAKDAEPAPEAHAEKKAAKSETARERFLRLAPARTTAALKRIELLGNLTGSSYQYEPDEAQQILDAMFDAVHDLKRKFEKAKARKSGRAGFTFVAKSAKQAAALA
jgi:hypothetical protein